MPADYRRLGRMLSLSADGNPITNIGNVNTDFDTNGGLKLNTTLSFLAGGSNTMTFTKAGDGGSRTITFPDSSDTVATLAATQTLTNKTFTSPAVNSATIIGGTATGLTDLDLAAGNRTIFDTVGANTLTIGAANTTVVVAGDFTVTGTNTTVSSTVIVADPLVALATDNTANAVDIGFFGRYRTNGTNLYTGFVWDASASKYILFHGNQAAPTTTVNTSGTGYTASTLVLGTLESANIAAHTLTGKLTAGSSEIEGTNFDINGGTVDAITSLTVANNVDIGSYDLRASTLTADSLTSGRVIFAGTNGVLSDDSDFTFSTDTLTVTNIAAFTLTGKLTANAEVEGSNFDINGGTIDGVTITSPTLQGTINPGTGLTLPAVTLSGNLSRAGDQTIALTGNAHRTLTVQNTTSTRVAHILTDGQLKFMNNTDYSISLSGTPTADRTITFPDATDTAVLLAATQTLSNKTLSTPVINNAVLTAPEINDTSSDHQYTFGVSELTADRTVTLPLLTGNDVFVFAAHAQTLTNKTLTSPTINAGTINNITAISIANNVDVGDYTIRANNFLADSHTSSRVFFAGTNGALTSDSDFTFVTDTLTVTKIGSFEAAGAINFATQAMTNVNIDSGDIASGVTINGNAATATEATNITAVANNSTDETVYPTFVDGATGTQGIETDTGLSYNPSSGALTSASFSGALTGNVTGNVSGSSGSTTGNAATATEATNITAVANNSTNETVYITFVDGATGTQGIETDTGLSYNPSTGALTATSFTGTVSGNIDTATRLATPRTIGGVSFDGTANIVPNTITVTDSTDTTSFIAMFDSATGDLAPKTDAGITYNAGTGMLTATGFTGPLTGNASGSAATVTGAAQSAITSLGTLTTLATSGSVYINDTANANSTIGLTINQGANDNTILALKSSDVAHGRTDVAETDTFGELLKSHGASGGLLVRGIKDGDGTAGQAVLVEGILNEAADTTHSASGIGVVNISSYIGTGSGRTNVGSNGNLLAIQNGTTTRFIFDSEGDFFADASINNDFYDSYNDPVLVRDLDLAITERFDDWVQYNRADIEKAKLAHFDEDGKPFVNWTRVWKLHNGAIWQLNEKIERLEQENKELKTAIDKILPES